MILAGTWFQVPVIKYARDCGFEVITCDNRPGNPGHKFANKYYNVSTTDIKGVLEISEKEKISGILAYGTDVAAPAAAYVAEKLGLVGNSYETALVLTDKGRFRKFLSGNGFNVPDFLVCRDLSAAVDYCSSKKGNFFVKPVDSSGSKGVSKLNSSGDINEAFRNAMAFSRKGEVIIEDEIICKGPHIHGEGYIYNGELKFLLPGDQYFSSVNPCAPLSTTLPGLYHREITDRIRTSLEKLLREAEFRTGGLNVEIIRDADDRIFFIETGPRNGGNLMPELAQMASGINLPAINVSSVMDRPADFSHGINDYIHCTQVILHSHSDGRLSDIVIPSEFSEFEKHRLMHFRKGDSVRRYGGAQDVVGVLLYSFDNKETCRKLTDYIRENNLVSLRD